MRPTRTRFAIILRRLKAAWLCLAAPRFLVAAWQKDAATGALLAACSQADVLALNRHIPDVLIKNDYGLDWLLRNTTASQSSLAFYCGSFNEYDALFEARELDGLWHEGADTMVFNEGNIKSLITNHFKPNTPNDERPSETPF